jgi:acyl-CoA oxidase
MGTIAPHVESQPKLKPLLKQLERFELCAEFMLTEIGHGLDARSIETTATLSEDRRSFDLHTPSSAAAKSMPPTTPLGNVPKVAVVFAQLIVDNEVHGVRTFVVRITEGNRMCRGISSKLLPQRPGTRPLDHALTWFSHVRVDRDCLLGTVDKPDDVRSTFFEQTHRVTVGGLALSLFNVPALKAAAYLAYVFSQKRMVNNPTSNMPVPVLSFPTQYGPIISAAAHAAVMEAAGRSAISLFTAPGVSAPVRHAIACVYKATATFATQRHFSELSERCGWRGMFAFNKISELQLALKGNSIAEGDVTVLCISKSKPLATVSALQLLTCCSLSGLASELLQGRYQFPPSSQPGSMLAKHERGVFDQLQRYLTVNKTGPASHRSDAFAQHVTPRARDLVQAIGHSFFYDSALSSDLVSPELLDVWEADCMLEDAAWYVEHAGMSSENLHRKRILAIERVRPQLQSVIDGFGMEEFFGDTPLVSEEGWDEFVRDLPAFGDGLERSRL